MNSRTALLSALTAVLLFSSAPPCMSKVQLDAVMLGICRLGIASLGMTFFLALRWTTTRPALQAWNRRTTRALLAVGLVFGIHWLLFFISVKMSGAAIGAIGFSTYGVHLMMLGWFLHGKRVTGIELLGLSLACVGTWLLIPEFSFQNQHTLGLAIGILSGLVCAFLPLLHQHYSEVDSNLRTWGQFTFALPVFVGALPWSEWNLPSSEIPLVLYLGLGVALVGHGLWVQAITVLSFATTSLLSYLYLPLSLLLSFLMLGEQLTGRALLGALLALVANALVLISQTRRGTMAA